MTPIDESMDQTLSENDRALRDLLVEASAWMGDLKNKDLVQEFGGQGGFWDGLSRGVEEIMLEDGNLYLKLRE